VKSLVAVPTPLGIVADVLGMADRDLAHVPPHQQLDDILGDGVQEMVLTAGLLPPQSLSLSAGAVIALCLVLALSEVVLVFLQCVPGVEDGVFADGDGGEVRDAEVDPCGVLARLFRRVESRMVDDVEFPPLARPHRTHLLDAFSLPEIPVGSHLVLAEDVILRLRGLLVVAALAEAEAFVFGVVAESLVLPCGGAAGVLVAALAVAGAGCGRSCLARTTSGTLQRALGELSDLTVYGGRRSTRVF
jgi:hypothetical protein